MPTLAGTDDHTLPQPRRPDEIVRRLEELGAPEAGRVGALLEEFLASGTTSDRRRQIAAELAPLELRYMPRICPPPREQGGVLISLVGLQSQPIRIMARLVRPRLHVLLHTTESAKQALEVEDDPELRGHTEFQRRELVETDLAENWERVRRYVMPQVKAALARWPGPVYVDVTGGLKALSVFGGMVASFYGFPLLYLHGRQVQGVFMPLSGVLVELADPRRVHGDLTRDHIQRLFRMRSYGPAVAECRAALESHTHLAATKYLELLLPFLAAYWEWDLWWHAAEKKERPLWERLAAAVEAAARFGLSFAPAPQVQDNIAFLRLLEGDLPDRAYAQMVDLYANGLRRLAQAKFDDAFIRFFRVVDEALTLWLGQEYGLRWGEEGAPDWSRYLARVGCASLEDLRRVYGARFGGDRLPEGPSPSLDSRIQLVVLAGEGDRLYPLVRRARSKGIQRLRNKSYLVHEHRAISAEAAKLVQQMAWEFLQQVMQESGRDAGRWLAMATHPDLDLA